MTSLSANPLLASATIKTPYNALLNALLEQQLM